MTFSTFGPFTAPGATNPVDTGAAPQAHTVQIVTTGTPTTCTVQLEGSLDDAGAPSNWSNLSGPQTVTGPLFMFHVANRPIRLIRVNITALSGGSSPTVAVRYMGV